MITKDNIKFSETTNELRKIITGRVVLQNNYAIDIESLSEDKYTQTAIIEESKNLIASNLLFHIYGDIREGLHNLISDLNDLHKMHYNKQYIDDKDFSYRIYELQDKILKLANKTTVYKN